MDNEEIERIETKLELNNKIDFVKKNRFPSNRIIYGGTEYIIRNQDGHLLEFDKRKFIEDYFHKGYFFEGGYNASLNKVANVINIQHKYNPKEDSTWIRIGIDRIVHNGLYAETADHNELERVSKSIISSYYGELKSVCNPDEEMEHFGFVKGKINPNYWFHKHEIEFLDKMLPYKKFDHTAYKTNITQLQKQLEIEEYPSERIKEEISKTIKSNIKFGVESLTYSAFEGLRYSFGVEIETCIGRIEPSEYENLNVKAVHDGSLRDDKGNTPGGEYVTGILVGDAGLVQLNELCRVLATKCKVNNLCGVHVHVGGMEWSKEDICYAYILAEQLEDELFNILPKTRRNNSYCRRLTQLTLEFLPELKSTKSSGEYNILIDRIYDVIFKEVTYIKGKNALKSFSNEEGVEVGFSSSREQNRNRNHPNGSKCGYDKGAQRYCWLNFVTLLYNTKGMNGSRTLEIRNHSATMNFNKIKNWIKIFFAMIRFIEMNKSKIRRGKVTLEEVIKAAYPKTHEKLIEYVNERRELFKVQGESIDYEEPSESRNKKTMKEIVSI